MEVYRADSHIDYEDDKKSGTLLGGNEKSVEFRKNQIESKIFWELSCKWGVDCKRGGIYRIFIVLLKKIDFLEYQFLN